MRLSRVAACVAIVVLAGCTTATESSSVESIAKSTTETVASSSTAASVTTVAEPAVATTSEPATTVPVTEPAAPTTAAHTGTFQTCAEGQVLNDHDGDGWGGCTTPTTTTAPPPPVAFTGSGDSYVELPDGAAYVAEIGHTGGGNFAIWLLDANLERVDLLVNESGGYIGRRPVNLLDEGATGMQITAGGAWSITLLPFADGIRQPAPGPITGAGTDVVYLESTDVYQIDHVGESNFAVWAYTDSDSDLLVNEIGNYSGVVPIRAPAILVIEADGAWTITAT